MKAVVIAVLLIVQGCRSYEEPKARCPSETAEFLRGNRERYVAAISRARDWLAQLDVDPIELRQHGVKGKKKLTEILDAYHRLYQIADPFQKGVLLAHIRGIAAITYEPRYHDMNDVDDTQFKQDATSYLRAALLIEQLGLDTKMYREEIKKIQPRLDAHLPSRGVNQRLAFHEYYVHFDLVEPFPLEGARAEGIIGRRLEAAKLSRSEAYDLTHEVFVPYAFGDRLDADPFDADAKAYLRNTLQLVLARYILARDPDLVAELISCLRMLRFSDPIYRDGLAMLLDSQHEDGSWGDIERAERQWGDQAREAAILHTTMVVIEALAIAFDPAWNPPEGC